MISSAGLGIENNRKISFVKNHYFILDEKPAEVKTLFKEINEKHGEKYHILNENQNRQLENNFIPTIKEFAKSPKILNEYLKKGIVDQKGKILFLNILLDQVSPVFTSISEYKNNNLYFSNALEKGFNEIRDQIVLVIIIFHAIHEEYKIFSLSINVAIDKDSLRIQ